MDEIRDCTHRLIQAILESEEYRRFSEVRDRVKQQPELRSAINAFRLDVFETQNASEPMDMYAEQERLLRDYEEFRKNTLVNDFLQTELSVCRIIQKVTAEIADALDLDTQDIAERIRF